MKIVIAPHAGGLGDALLYSTLPELYARRGDEVYIAAHVAPRNPEMPELVWRHNPFVKGLSNDEPNAGCSIWRGLDFIREAKVHRSPIRAVEELHGFAPTNDFPRIYYKPKWREEFRNTVFCDPTSISQPCAATVFNESVAWMARWKEFNMADVTVLTSRHVGPAGRDSLAGFPRYPVSSIFEYVDCIYSCRLFIAAESGSQVLASAIRGAHASPEVIGIHTTMSWNDHIFTFPNVYHIVTGRMTKDFHDY